MRLYAVALIIWAATVTVSTDSNVASLSDEKAIGYGEFRDLPTKQLVQPYLTREAAAEEDSSQTDAENRADDAASDLGLSKPATRAENANGPKDASANDSSQEPIYATPFTAEANERRPFDEHLSSDGSRYTIAEDVFLVENAGSFGQKVRQGQSDRTTVRTAAGTTDGRQLNDEHRGFRKPLSSTVSPLEVDRVNIHASIIIQDSSSSPMRKESGSSANDPVVVASSSTTRRPDEILQVVSSTESSRISAASTFENDVVPEPLPRPQARLSQARNITESVTRKPAGFAEQKRSSESVVTSTSVEISPSLQLTKFSGPIVVPELPTRVIHDVAIDYVDDELPDTSKPVENAGVIAGTNVRSSSSSSKTTPKGITASSIMLNPLQVGIILTNAGEMGLMGDSEHSAATDTEEDYLGDEPQQHPASNEGSVQKRGNHSDVGYEDETFRHAEEQQEKQATEFVTRRAPENTVEIQKSIELYHTAPIQEIHYPVEYVQHGAHLGAVETNNLGGAQRSRQPYDQDERTNYDARGGNDVAEKTVVKVHATPAFPQKLIRQEYNALEDDIGKPTVSALIAEYSPGAHEQTPFESLEPQPLQYNDVKPVLLVANQFDEQPTNVRHYLSDSDESLYTRPAESTRQEVTSEFVKPNAYQQPTNQPLNVIGHQQPFRLPEARRPESTQLLLKIIPNGSSAESGFLVPLPRPYPIEKIIEKTVHVPHPVEIEKVIEKKVPVAVPVPQPYPVHVPIDRVVEKRVPQLYPIHFERVIEKRLPYTVQRLLIQPPPYPLHLRLPTAYPAAPIENSAEKTKGPAIRPSRPYRTDAERLSSDNGAGSIESKYKYHQRPREQPFAGENTDHRGTAFEQQQSQIVNASHFYGDSYGRPPLAYDYNVDVVGKSYIPAAQVSNIKLMILPKKFAGHHVLLRPQATAPPYTTLPVSFRRQIVYNLVEKDKTIKDEYVGPVPPRKAFISQAKQLFSTSVTQSPATTTALRRTRQPETQYPGSFRQSKMEYGFKPPMVPSVQYDENTASKVEN